MMTLLPGNDSQFDKIKLPQLLYGRYIVLGTTYISITSDRSDFRKVFT